ncbi:putative acyl-activating enzyme 6 [Wolffia australiana]
MEALTKANSANGCPLTPLSFLERAATVYGDCASVVYKDEVFTWAQTLDRCLRLASSLVRLGVSPGDVVSVVAPNTPAMYEMHFGVPMSGAVLNTLNTRLDARTISVLLRHAESRVVFVDGESRSVVEEALARFGPGERKPVVVPVEDGELAAPAEAVTYESLVRGGDPRFRWVRPASDWTPMVLNHTSGTTAEPKGVVHCHRGLFVITVDSLLSWSVPTRPVYLWTLPMYHANGWSFPWGMAAAGGTNVCLRRFDAAAVYAVIRRHRVTHLCGAPVVLNMLASAAEDAAAAGPPVEILTAGAPPPAAVLLRAEAKGFRVSHGYGLTETAGLVVTCAWKPAWDGLPAGERARIKARQGVRTLGTAEVDVVEPETGRAVARDGKAMGEVVLRGGSLMLGYLKDPAGTERCIRGDGWFYTGDVGVVHPDGYVEIRDRSKDVIISGGENISSVEVESVLYTHPGVYEAAVVARPDEHWGETPCAFVSPRPGPGVGLSEEEIVAYCRERLPKYMVPKTVVVRDELPKTSTGKIQKFLLRDMARALGPTRPASRM